MNVGIMLGNEGWNMNVKIRKWKPEDAASLAAALSNKNVLNNLRDDTPPEQISQLLPYNYKKSHE